MEIRKQDHLPTRPPPQHATSQPHHTPPAKLEFEIRVAIRVRLVIFTVDYNIKSLSVCIWRSLLTGQEIKLINKDYIV